MKATVYDGIMVLEISGIQVELVRKNIKSLSIRVQPSSAKVRVSAPWFVSQTKIAEFVTKNQAWIRRQQQRLADTGELKPQLLLTGETVPFWGEAVKLRLEEGASGPSIALEGTELLIRPKSGSDGEKRRGLLKEWYRARLSEAVTEALPHWETVTGLHPDVWLLKAMKTRWGSCNTRAKRIWLSLYLCQKPRECLEYVILHELCHLKVSNHGPEFKALMDFYMPDWRQRRQLLNAGNRGMVYF